MGGSVRGERTGAAWVACGAVVVSGPGPCEPSGVRAGPLWCRRERFGSCGVRREALTCRREGFGPWWAHWGGVEVAWGAVTVSGPRPVASHLESAEPPAVPSCGRARTGHRAGALRGSPGVPSSVGSARGGPLGTHVGRAAGTHGGRAVLPRAVAFGWLEPSSGDLSVVALPRRRQGGAEGTTVARFAGSERACPSRTVLTTRKPRPTVRGLQARSAVAWVGIRGVMSFTRNAAFANAACGARRVVAIARRSLRLALVRLGGRRRHWADS
ncbi:hypothetical protein FB559_0128 [Actinoallomurus bryophytorum]|uniref:Uncharacterized protein n=1 Tax=Actinoallomurus bryophytorum TaxID=1490222 RepID=A0A543CCD6_9ACTN|nr:hypothetical protein FB559_0128 [Actinoallomurus bryophytorum]